MESVHDVVGQNDGRTRDQHNLRQPFECPVQRGKEQFLTDLQALCVVRDYGAGDFFGLPVTSYLNITILGSTQCT